MPGARVTSPISLPVSLYNLAFIVFLSLFPTEASFGDLCRKWDGGKIRGQLDASHINEASGIAVSAKYPGRLYHINDSGGGPYFYTTGIAGGNLKKVKIEGFNRYRSDFEDISIGKCSGGNTCIFIADIGDNSESREYVELIAIEELEEFGSSAVPQKVLKLVYPDRAHNAEGLAVHPNGDIYILTKEEDLHDNKAYPSKLFRLSYTKRRNMQSEPVLLEYAGEIDLPRLIPDASAYGQTSTAFDISPDGKRFLILTYEDALEFNLDLNGSAIKDSKDMKEGIDFSVIELRSLPQQESVSYLTDGRGFMYNTEFKAFSVPLITFRCLN